MPVDVRPLNPALAVIAKEQLNEDADNLEEALAGFRIEIRKIPHLRSRSDDQFLIAFLRSCKYDLDRALKKLDMFYTLRTHIPELMLDRDPMDQKLRAIIRLGVGIPLPKTETSGSPRIFLIRHGAYDPSLYTIQDVIKVSTMYNDILVREDDNLVVAGQIGILDLAGVSGQHFAQYSPGFIKKMSMMSHEGSPIRQKGFHYINTPFGFEAVFNVFKSLMKQGCKTRLHVHGNDIESLFRVVPRRLMPLEYGGEAGPLQDIIDEWEQKILSYRQYFQEDEEQFGVDERLRVGGMKSAESLFSDEGTLSQLELD